MIGIVIVSHSEKLSQGVKEIAEQMNTARVPVVAAGGTGDGNIGTNPMNIKDAIEQLSDMERILIFADIGSSILSTDCALEMIDEIIKTKTIIVDAPLVEGVITAVIQASISDDIDTIIKVAQETRFLNKITNVAK